MSDWVYPFRPCRDCDEPLEFGRMLCDSCRDRRAQERYKRAREQYKPHPTPKKPCGTNAAYVRHLRNDEPPCQPCQDAHTERYREHQRKYRAPETRPDMFCLTCDASLPRGRSKYCSVECKMFDHATVRKIWIRHCAECGVLYVARDARHFTCGNTCARKLRNRSNARTRWKRSVRRSIERLTDITPAQEDQLRRRTRKCTLCGVWMTSKPSQPNTKHLDHIMPINIGGTHTHGNVRIICRDCNLKRPKDGGDYNGPITLWAVAPGVVAKPVKPKPVLTTKPVLLCACGQLAHSASVRCSQCTIELAKRAADMRADGMKWQDIADALGYPNVGSLCGLAQRHGDYQSRNRMIEVG